MTSGAHDTKFGTSFRWHPNPGDCPHMNDHACPVCDFDGHYRARMETNDHD